MIVAPDALNRLVAHLCESSMGGNMNLLLSFTAWAFHRHNDIGLVGHRRFLRAGGFYHGPGAAWIHGPVIFRCCDERRRLVMVSGQPHEWTPQDSGQYFPPRTFWLLQFPWSSKGRLVAESGRSQTYDHRCNISSGSLLHADSTPAQARPRFTLRSCVAKLCRYRIVYACLD